VASRQFDRLRDEVEREYIKRGFPPSRARYIGDATAGEVAERKRARRRARRTGTVHKAPARQTRAERLRNLAKARAALRAKRRR
jgi:hypothetical protein